MELMEDYGGVTDQNGDGETSIEVEQAVRCSVREHLRFVASITVTANKTPSPLA